MDHETGSGFSFTVERLDPRHHDREPFASGEPSLDEWLKNYASQTARKDGAQTYVACERRRILGYYSLCAFQVESVTVPGRVRLARHPVPGVLLARLAVDRTLRGHGLGGYLLLDALRVSAGVADQIGARLVVVQALHQGAVEFYRHHGFERFTSDPRRLYSAMNDVRATLDAVDQP